MVTGLFCAASGYISGHATAMHQHATVKDYKRMKDDLLGLYIKKE